MSPNSPAVQVENLYKIYGASSERGLARLKAGISHADLRNDGYIVALNNISLSVGHGEIYVIMGLSGSGKSTLLRCLNRLIKPTTGRVLIQGKDVTSLGTKDLRHLRATELGMVFQHFALLPHLSVLDNVAFGLRIVGVAKAERRRRAADALALVGLDGWGNRKPRDLSGGMRQRVGLARALVMDTPILLMDEPFSALDPLIREEMQQELLRLQTKLQKSIIFVTHDPNEAVTLGERIAILRDGALVQEASPLDLVLSPATDYVRRFMGGVSTIKMLTAGQAADVSHAAGHGASVVTAGSGLSPFPAPEYSPDGLVETQRNRGGSDPKSQIVLAPTDAIEPHLAGVASGRVQVIVRDAQGRHYGTVTPQSLVAALARNVEAPPQDMSSPTTSPPPKVYGHA